MNPVRNYKSGGEERKEKRKNKSSKDSGRLSKQIFF